MKLKFTVLTGLIGARGIGRYLAVATSTLILASFATSGSLFAGDKVVLDTKEVKKAPCDQVEAAVREAILKDPDKATEIVTDALATNPECACGVMEAAVKALTPANGVADPQVIANIVKTLIGTYPELAVTISDCAIAAAPNVEQAVLSLIAGITTAVPPSLNPPSEPTPPKEVTP